MREQRVKHKMMFMRNVIRRRALTAYMNRQLRKVWRSTASGCRLDTVNRL